MTGSNEVAVAGGWGYRAEVTGSNEVAVAGGCGYRAEVTGSNEVAVRRFSQWALLPQALHKKAFK